MRIPERREWRGGSGMYLGDEWSEACLIGRYQINVYMCVLRIYSSFPLLSLILKLICRVSNS